MQSSSQSNIKQSTYWSISRSFMHAFVPSYGICPWLIHSFTHSFIHSIIHYVIHLIVQMSCAYSVMSVFRCIHAVIHSVMNAINPPWHSAISGHSFNHWSSHALLISSINLSCMQSSSGVLIHVIQVWVRSLFHDAHSLYYSCLNSRVNPCIHALFNSLLHAFSHYSVCSLFIHPIIHTFSHSRIHNSHSCTHSFTHVFSH